MRHEDEYIRQFYETTGSDRLRKPGYLVLLTGLLCFAYLLMNRMGMTAGIILVSLPFIAFYLYTIFRKPIVGFYTIIAAGFLILGFSRYIIADIQIGLTADILMVLTYIALFFNKFYERINWAPAKKDVTMLALIWLIYCLLQFFNPEVKSHAAWFSGVRGIGLYMFMIIPLALVFIDDVKKLDKILLIWGIFSILASLKAIQQVVLGPDPMEKLWLETEGGSTHLIFGNLRAFGFLTDAGQFGANQAYSGVMATIVAFSRISMRRRLFFIAVAVFGFIGMFLSGTRGAMSIPLAGFFVFFILRKNIFVMTAGIVLLLVVFSFFKFTYIGQGNQFIRRMRSAFNPNDPSLQVRLENQRILKIYLKSRPIGGGIGHAGSKAKVYTPNSYLSDIATDSWYVLIWAELGIVGLVLHLFILFYILLKGSWLVMFRVKDPDIKMKLSALISGMFGVMVASYGNAVLGTMPTSFLIYTTMALIINSRALDKKEEEKNLYESKTLKI